MPFFLFRFSFPKLKSFEGGPTGRGGRLIDGDAARVRSSALTNAGLMADAVEVGRPTAFASCSDQ